MNKVTDIEEAMKFANEDNSNEKPTVKHEESTDNLTKSSKIVKNEKNDFTTSLLDKTEYFNYQFNYCYPIFLTLNACICSFHVGYNLGVFDTMQANMTKLFNWNDDIKDVYISLISSSVLVGAIIGSLTSGPVLRAYGRRRSFFIYNIVALVGMILSVIMNEYVIIGGRILVGLSAGAFSALIPIYVNEYVPYEISGACGVTIEMAYALGISISYVLGLGLPNPEDQTPENWYWCVMFLFPIALLTINHFVLLFYFKSDTPKYLVLKKQKEEALNVLREIYVNEEDINKLVTNLERLEENKNDGSVSFKQLFSKTFRKRLFIGIIACWGQQSNGIDTLIFYSNKIFNNNVEHSQATFLTNILGFVMFFSNILTIFVIERFGRKRLLVFGNIVSFLCLVSIITLYYFQYFLPIIFLFIAFVFTTGLTLAPVSYLYTSDILPENGMGIAVMFNYITTVVVVQTFPFLMNSWLKVPGSLSIFAFTNFLMLVLVVSFFKETKGKSPKEIEKLFK